MCFFGFHNLNFGGFFTDASRVAGERVARPASAPESRNRVDTNVQAASVVDSALVDVALALGLVLPLAAIIGSVANLVERNAHSAAAIKFGIGVASDCQCA